MSQQEVLTMLIRASFIAPFLRTTKLQGSFQKKASSLSSRKRCKSFVPLCCTSGQNDTPSVPLFEMRNVTFQIPFNFDVVLFRDMRFHINPGEFIIMIGSNGAGKSTGMSTTTTSLLSKNTILLFVACTALLFFFFRC